ncbi:MAG: RNA polymerase sigma factor [Acidobacteria bacterium]|nr:MAG: RNA polymerase sigma factor [Acidobacteriota bacterium]
MTSCSAEAELLGLARQGKEEAFLTLYERHRDCVFRFAYRMLGSVQLAEDVTHDCFLSLIQKPGLFDPSRSSLQTYLCAAARNLAYRRMRKMERETTVEIMPEVEADTQAGPLNQVLTTELAETVKRAVAALPPLQREAVILFEFEDLSLADIAAVAETDVGTIKSRLHRARERLRRLLAPWVESEHHVLTRGSRL